MTAVAGCIASEPEQVRWLGMVDGEALRQQALRRILEAAQVAIQQHGKFVIVLTGGRTARGLYKLLCNVHADWSRWHVFFSDERCLAADDSGRNSSMVSKVWLRHVAIPAEQIHVIPTERGAFEAAVAYTHTLRDVGEFDLVLLGLGPDGHTASLFPASLCTTRTPGPDAVAIFDAPKQPERRVSLSAARLSRARQVMFLVAGEGKRQVVAQWRANVDLPARTIRPTAGVDVLVESSLLTALH